MRYSNTSDRNSSRTRLLALVLAGICGLLISVEPIPVRSQTGDPTAKLEPSFREYKGVSLGMTVDETRKKLGAPEDKGEEQDFYVFSEKESAQIYYDKTKHVDAFSINYIGESSNVPKPQAVLGTDVETTLQYGLYPFILGGIIKALIAAGLLPLAWWSADKLDRKSVV